MSGGNKQMLLNVGDDINFFSEYLSAPGGQHDHSGGSFPPLEEMDASSEGFVLHWSQTRPGLQGPGHTNSVRTLHGAMSS